MFTSESLTLCIYVSLHGKRHFADVIKIGTLAGEISLDYSVGPSEIIQVLKVEERGREGDMMTKQGRNNVRWGGRNLPLLTLQRQEAALSQGVWVSLEAGKCREADSSLEPADRHSALTTLQFQPMKLVLDFEPTELWHNTCALSLVKLVVICCCRIGKVIHKEHFEREARVSTYKMWERSWEGSLDGWIELWEDRSQDWET